jgi:uncharacterized protein YacL
MEQYVFFAVLLLQIELFVLIFVLILPRIRTKTKRLQRPCFIDTSVLMDGRITHAAITGFVPRQMVIPKSVLAELQLLADGSDSDKRTRARQGLDVAKSLQELPSLEVIILDDGDASKGVDQQLIDLAKKHRGSICTIDYNLNKVATVEGVIVLNINELAKELRMSYLPGEKMSLTIVQKGNDAHQGVGYLADGTMVVVEQAQRDVGKQVEVEFIRSLQTAAGRMLFAKRVTPSKPSSGGTNKVELTREKQQRHHSTAATKSKSNGRRRTASKSEDALIDLVESQS